MMNAQKMIVCVLTQSVFLLSTPAYAEGTATEYSFIVSSSSGACLAATKQWSAEQAQADGCTLIGKKESKLGNSIMLNCTAVPKWNVNEDKKRPYVWTTTKEHCQELAKFLFRNDAVKVVKEAPYVPKPIDVNPVTAPVTDPGAGLDDIVNPE